MVPAQQVELPEYFELPNQHIYIDLACGLCAEKQIREDLLLSLNRRDLLVTFGSSDNAFVVGIEHPLTFSHQRVDLLSKLFGV